MANPSAKIPVLASEYEIPHEYRHGRPYYPSPADQIDEMKIPRRNGRPYHPSPADGINIDETMQIPRRHGRPYYPSEPAAGKIDPRRHGRPYHPSSLILADMSSKQSHPSHDYQHVDYDDDVDYDYDYDYQPKLPPFMNGPQIYPSKAAGNGNGIGNGYAKKKKPAAVPVATSDESALRKKLYEIHAHDAAAAFHTEPLLESIRGILDHLDAAHRFTNSHLVINTPTILVDKYPTTTQPTTPDSILDTLPYLLHKITCMLNCKCGGGDGHALALEILEVVANYTWDAKIVMVLAAFAVEFGQYGLVTTLYRDNKLAKLLAFLRQTPDVVEVEVEVEEGDADFMIIRSKMETIIRIARMSIEVTKLIAKFDCFPSKHITPDAEPMLVALNQIPISVYWMIRVVIACASEHSQILGHTQIMTSYTETWSITSLEKKMGVIWKIFTTQHELCHTYIEEKIEKQFYDKLKGMFSQTTIYEDNQKIFQAIFNTKDYMRPLSHAGSDVVGVDVLKRKTVLLLISDLTISEEIAIMSRFYTESRRGGSSQYEIVWVPIVKQREGLDEERFEGLKSGMPWYVVDKPNLLKPGFVRYVREEWRYSKKTIMVALDQRGRVVHQNALHMMMTWGNAAHPFTYRHEYAQWNITREWSLTLLLQDIDINISSWITEKKVICLYGGHDYNWISRFIEMANHVANEASIELEMVYICKKVTTKEHITRVTNIIGGGRSEFLSNLKSAHFWKRIESMMQSKVQLGGAEGAGAGAGDRVLAELIYMSTLGESEKGWAVISGGAGAGIARATGDAIPDAFDHFEEWSDGVGKQGFTAALSGYLAKGNEDHRCTELVLPWGEDIHGIVVCAECGQPMERRVTFGCPAAATLRSSVSG